MEELLKNADIDDNKKSLFTDFSKILDFISNCDYEYLDRKSETVIPTNESFLYISNYLKEKYGEKYEMFDNLSLTDLKVKWVSNQTKKEILDFLFEKFCFYLEQNNIDNAFKLLYADIENSKSDDFFSMYYVLYNTVFDITAGHSFMTKKKIKNLTSKEISIYKFTTDSMYDFDSNTIIMENSNDAIESCVFLHEFIHYYNFIKVNNSSKQALSSNVFEFPSIVFELDYAKWLRKNSIITENDMFSVLFQRIQSSTVEIAQFFKSSLDAEDLNCEHSAKSINYVMSCVLALYVLNQIDKDDSFREKLNNVNDNLYKSSYEDILETIGLDRNDPNFINLLISNFEEFIKNNTLVNERNEKTR